MNIRGAHQHDGPGAHPSGVSGGFVDLPGEGWMYRIAGYDRLEPFLVSVTSPDDHWLFASTSGALTCGRVSPERALFPYETDDRLHRAGGMRGPITTLRIGERLWTPLFGEPEEGVSRHLYKRPLGDRLVFEEVHGELGLTLRSRWATSRRFGLVRTVTLERHEGFEPVEVELLDGLVDLQPALVSLRMRQAISCLVDAYSRSERIEGLPLALYSLEARIVDRPEPAEALRANAVWSIGLEALEPAISLREDEVLAFSRGLPTVRDALVTGRRGAFFQRASAILESGAPLSWHVVGEVHLDHADAAALVKVLGDPVALRTELEADLRAGGRRLRRLVASVDGLQHSADHVQTAAHAASALFNAMRGGVFVDGHTLPAADLAAFVRGRSHGTYVEHRAFFEGLEDGPTDEVLAAAEAVGDPDLTRLVLEYLPLWFSRRHGDPSRPWNHFAIRLEEDDGSRRLDWEGNWRDIFQNWEALCESFPAFAPGAVATFVNASSADGGNPYRITRSGLDWEVPDPDDPWSHIGYWGDHQIVYLLRLLQLTERVRPGRLAALLDRGLFTYAEIPYQIAPYDALLTDPHHTITFDEARHARILERVEREGADGRLLRDGAGELVHATLAEKLLVPLASKVCNLVVGGGVWMNTQRPEWNDANNALAGWGLSVVTTAHLIPYCAFVGELLSGVEGPLRLTEGVATWLEEVRAALAAHRHQLVRPEVDDHTRKQILDDLGWAFSSHRERLYREGLGGPRAVDAGALGELVSLAQTYCEHTLRANRRADGLYHGYNLMQRRESEDPPESSGGAIAIGRLPLMLEGQVAALDSGLVGPEEAADMLDALFASALYRADQHSFVLYPPVKRPGFLRKNAVPAKQARGIPLLAALLDAGDTRIVSSDVGGQVRFCGDFANAGDLAEALDALARQEPERWPRADRAAVLELWEATFDHRSFTGRSGTMYAYEGIGSIYWHMVSKLQLATQSVHAAARAAGAEPKLLSRLARHYHAIRAGLGPAKSPALQGAFPTDPHSHTPAHKGAQQPGMTGQAKEAVLVRWRELGVRVESGVVAFDPVLLPRAEVLPEPEALSYVSAEGEDAVVPVPAGGLAFTYCQVPVVYVAEKETPADAPVRVSWRWADGREEQGERELSAAASAALLGRTGALEQIEVRFPRARLWG